MTLLNAARLAAPLRAVADSFAAREAVRVQQQLVGTVEAVDTTGTAEVLGTPSDVVAIAAEEFSRALMPAHTTWYVRFARDRIVLAYDDSSRGATAIDSTNWWKVLQRRGVRVGRADPSASAAGYRALLVMQLAEGYYREPKLAARLLASSPERYVQPTEADLLTSLQSGQLDYTWTHESVARAAGVRMLRFPHEIDLGEPADSAHYAAAEVAVPVDSGGDTLRIRGAPVAYGISIPRTASSPRHAERFLRFVLSDEGRRVLEAAHLDVLAEPVAVGTDVPPAIAASLGPGRHATASSP